MTNSTLHRLALGLGAGLALSFAGAAFAADNEFTGPLTDLAKGQLRQIA
jgi:hypothetical protein